MLLWAAKKGQLPLVERLLDNGSADPTITNIYNQTPLLWAANNGHYEKYLHSLMIIMTRMSKLSADDMREDADRNEIRATAAEIAADL